MKTRKLLAILVAVAMIVTMLPVVASAALTDYSTAASRVTKVDPADPDVGEGSKITVQFRDSNRSAITGVAVGFYVQSSRDAEDLYVTNDSTLDFEGVELTEVDPVAGLDDVWWVTGIPTENGYLYLWVTSGVPGEVTLTLGKLLDDDNNVTRTFGSATVTFGEAAIDAVELVGENEVQAGEKFTITARVLDSDGIGIEGEEVEFFEKYSGGSSKSIGKAITDVDGEAELDLRRTKAGTYEFRAKAGSEYSDWEEQIIYAGSPYSIEADAETVWKEVDEEATITFFIKDRYGNKLKQDAFEEEIFGLRGDVWYVEVTDPDGDEIDVEDDDYGVDDDEWTVTFEPDMEGEYIVEAFIAGTSISAVTKVQVGEFGDVEKLELEIDDERIRGYEISSVTGTTTVTAYVYDENGIKKEIDPNDNEVAFSSSDPAIATVGRWTGEVTAVEDESGVVTITGVHLETGLTASVDVVVFGKPVALEADVEADDLLATVTLNYVDKDGLKAVALEEDGESVAEVTEYTVIVPTGVEVTEQDDFEDGEATFVLEADDYGTYSIRVVTDFGISKTFTVDFTEEVEPVVIGANKVVLTIGGNFGFVDGAVTSLDAPAFIEGGRTFVPVRFLAEAFGAEADWTPKDGPVETVYLEREDMTITIGIGDSFLTVTKDGEAEVVTFDAPARIVNGRTFLPFRAIAEAFGAEVDYGPVDGPVEWVSFEQ